MTKIKPDPKRMTAARLKQIKIFVESQDPGVPLLRSFIDDWFAYKTGGPFLGEKGGRPIEFTNPKQHKGKSRKKKDKPWEQMVAGMNAMHFISKDACTVLNYKGDDKDIASLGVNYPRLIVDHVVPVKVIWKLLLESPAEEIESTLCKVYRLGVITKCEQGEKNCRKKREDSENPKKYLLCEDCRLVEAGYHQKVPDGWEQDDDVFARYVAAKIPKS